MVEQVGTPRELYAAPANVFVAQFIGSPKMNILPSASAGSAAALAPGDANRVGMRPEHLEVVSPDEGMLRGRVLISEYTGASTLLHVELDSGETCLIVEDGEAPEPGAHVGLRIDPANLHFFGADGRSPRPG